MLKQVGTKLINKTGRMGLLAKKHSPEIMVGVGVVSIIGGAVMTVRATLKVTDILDEAEKNLETIDTVSKDESVADIYSDEDVMKDKVIVYTQTGVKIIKLYAPAIILTTVGIGCMLGSHNVLKKRNLAMVAAYKGIEEAFYEYRHRVLEEFGEDKDRELRYGIKETEVTETIVNPETGRDNKVKVKKDIMDPNTLSMYAKFFDELNPNYVKNPEYNMMFLRSQQNYWNDMLHARGHVFLNEVYSSLGIKHTQAGAVVGWVISNEGDNFIDFGLYKDGKDRRAIDFVNGEERAILLDFNVDGVVYDKI